MKKVKINSEVLKIIDNIFIYLKLINITEETIIDEFSTNSFTDSDV